VADAIKLNMPFVGIPSFCRFPICFDLDTLDADIAILGIPYDDGASYRPGVRFAPRRIREMSLRHSARGSRPTGYYEFETQQILLDHEIRNDRIRDCGDVDVIYTKPMNTMDNITTAVATILNRGAFPVCFGGDHSVTFAIVKAYDVEPIDIVTIDAHLDFTDDAVGVTHAGMNPFRRCADLPNVRKIVHVGIRGIRNSKKVRDEAIANGNVIVTPIDLRRRGTEACLTDAGPLQNVYLSIDIDGLDPSIAPGCSGSDPGGLLFQEAIDIMSEVTAKASVIGFDVTEVNPSLDVGDMTSGLSAMLTLRFLGMATGSPHWKNRELKGRTTFELLGDGWK